MKFQRLSFPLWFKMQNCGSFLKEAVAVQCPWGHTLSAQGEFVQYRVCRCPRPSPGQLSQGQHISLVSPIACIGAGTCSQALLLLAVVSPTEGHMMQLNLCNTKLEGWIKSKHKQPHFLGAREWTGHTVTATRTLAVCPCLTTLGSTEENMSAWLHRALPSAGLTQG